MAQPMTTDDLGIIEQLVVRLVTLHLLVLQIINRQGDHSKPAFNCLVALQTEITQSQSLFQIQVIDLDRLSFLIIAQGLLHTQSKIGADKVLRAFIVRVPFRNNGADLPSYTL